MPSQLALALSRMIRKGKLPKLPSTPRPRTPDTLERDYYRDLRKIIDDLKGVIDIHLTPQMDALFKEASEPFQFIDSDDGIRKDSLEDLIFRVFSGMRVSMARRLTEREAESLAEHFAERGQRFNKEEIERQFRRVLGVSPLIGEPYLKEVAKSFTRQNVSLIQSIPEQYFNKVEGLVRKATQEGMLNRDLAGKLKARLGSEIAEVTTNVDARCRLIARDQIAKYNSRLNEVRQRNLGVDSYEWVTVGDDRVRDSHRHKNGEVFQWSNSPADTGHPGEDFQCRCIAKPIFNYTGELGDLLND